MCDMHLKMNTARSMRSVMCVMLLTAMGDGARGQTSFAPNDIFLGATDARSVSTADLDGDGDIDVLSASFGDDAIRWYENNGGSPPNFIAHDISLTADGAICVATADVDGDGDTDVLTASFRDNAIRWYENDRASPPTFIAHDISLAADGAFTVYATDLDRDGDIDILSGSSNDDAIRWHENDGATVPGFTTHTVSLSADAPRAVFAADLDRDGDIDVLSASQADGAIRWYENDGASPPAFAMHVITTSALAARSVMAVDIDHDGDMDVLSASRDDDAIRWYQNDGNALPAFATYDISTVADGAYSVFGADVDGDGDTDVLSASVNDDAVRWYENDGGSPPVFASRGIWLAANAATSVCAADMDGDGDIDVLSASSNDGAIRWYENRPACRADVTTQGAPPGDPKYGQPDGLVTAADLNFYVNLWVVGCP